jgi:benzoate/toluate 1,2-dioxygenase reductase subunit
VTAAVDSEVEGTQVPSTSLITLQFSDGETREVRVPEGTSVLAAAKDQGVALASQCTVGTCSTCVAVLSSGEAEMPKDQITVLTRHEVAEGQRLLCQTFASTDSTFRLEYPSRLLEANPAVRFTAKVVRLDWLAESVVQLDLKVPKTMRFSFTAGQYARIRIPGTDEWRSYSMASGEHEKNRVSFLIRVLPSGTMSDFLRNEAKVGMALELDGPLGGFVFEPSDRPHLLLAGGTGLAPMLSMLDKLRLMRPTPPITLVFGCVREADLFLLDELDARRSFMPSLDVVVSLEQETDRAGIRHGNPVAAIDPAHVPAGAVAYLCGPPGMIHAAELRLEELGLAPSDIRAEQFLPSDN